MRNAKSRKPDGQTSLAAMYEPTGFGGCDKCLCRNCLYWWSGRCPYGGCYDDLRAKENPYDKAHPNEPPRDWWSNWREDQAHWCRGGIFYSQHICTAFIRYEGSKIQECFGAPVQVFQDGHIRCSLVDTVGCEACMERFEAKEE